MDKRSTVLLAETLSACAQRLLAEAGTLLAAAAELCASVPESESVPAPAGVTAASVTVDTEASKRRGRPPKNRDIMDSAASPSPVPPSVKAVRPTVSDIRAKAVEYDVNVDDLIPQGKNPSLAAKNDAMRRIIEAKRAKEASSANGADTDPVGAALDA